jgi:hypothetical protein
VIQTAYGAISGAGGVGVILAILSWLRGRKADRADVNRVNIDTAIAIQTHSLDYVQRMMQPLEERLRAADVEVDEMRQQLRKLRHEMESLLRRAEMAEAVLRANGLPVPLPDRDRYGDEWGN